MKTPQTRNLLLILALACLFIEKSGSVSPNPVLTGPDKAYLNTGAVFQCTAPDYSPPVTLELTRDSVLFNRATVGDSVNQTATFYQKITAASEGSYQCKATAGERTGVSNIIKLTVVIPPSYARLTSEPFPPVAYEGSRFVLSCDVARGSHLSYNWFFNRTKINPSASSPSFHLSDKKLVLETVSHEYAGHYSCMAWSSAQGANRFSSSTEVQLTVKDSVSEPRISFSISKDGDSYRGNVTCWTTRGSPPVNFSLSLDDSEVGSVTGTESLTAWFPVALEPGLDMGVARCRVKTPVQDLISEPLTLLVVPVGGSVKVETEILRVGSKPAAARLKCLIDRGTFPHVSWSLNNSAFPPEKHLDPGPSPYILTDQGRTLLLAELGPQTCGYYRCRARDSYDASGPWVESTAVLVKVKDRILTSMNQSTSSAKTPTNAYMNTIEVMTITFCCFLLLMLAIAVGCVYKMFDNEQAHIHIPTTDPSPDTLPLSEPESQLVDMQAYDSLTELDVQSQMLEITL